MRSKNTQNRPRILVLEGLSGSSEGVWEAGGTAVSVSPFSLERAVAALDRDDIDGLLLTGGGDVDPRLFGQRAHPRTYGVNETRDLVEFYALEVAGRRGIPVLGICRGAQLMNVEAGGSLKQDIPGHRSTDHAALTIAGSNLRRTAGARFEVVSLHHQEVDKLGDGLHVAARAPDGTVEAVESLDGRVLGVQWHPEMDAGSKQARDIFRWLVVEAAARAGLSVPAPKVRKFAVLAVKPARVTRLPVRRRKAQPVSVSWHCPDCGMHFDKQVDREDHIAILHGRRKVAA